MSNDEGKGQVGDSRSVFGAHIRDVLDREYDRSARSIARAETIVKTQLSLITVIIAVAAFLYRDNLTLSLRPATISILLVGLTSGVASFALAAYGQSKATTSSATSIETLTEMLAPERWLNEPDPLFIVANRHKETIADLRKTNGERARVNDGALIAQGIFIALAVIAVGVEVTLRLV